MPRLPAPLIAVAAGIAALGLFGLPSNRSGTCRKASQPSSRPTSRSSRHSGPARSGIALMSFAETIAVARAFAQTGEPAPRANQELLATGLASAAGSVFGSMPAGGRHVADRAEPPGGERARRSPQSSRRCSRS
jgi:MFS superfamily sulfate permease-like transporter